ncbi:hypothetical protein B0H14DRAFT_2577028 [Mycena olivaceomarginata]|nr:hypothetical protein B0H14DRAFT_2577028 [Mycena olivaceomarginata]
MITLLGNRLHGVDLGGWSRESRQHYSGDNNSFSAATGIPETIESAIWSYDPATQAITAQWINTDGSAPATHIVYANDFNQALVLTGSVAAFQDIYVRPAALDWRRRFRHG